MEEKENDSEDTVLPGKEIVYSFISKSMATENQS